MNEIISGIFEFDLDEVTGMFGALSLNFTNPIESESDNIDHYRNFMVRIDESNRSLQPVIELLEIKTSPDGNSIEERIFSAFIDQDSFEIMVEFPENQSGLSDETKRIQEKIVKSLNLSASIPITVSACII